MLPSNLASKKSINLKKKAGITLYGRKPVLEALSDPALSIYRLHMAKNNRPTRIISELLALAASRKVAVIEHDRLSLSRISKNSRQDQGVALDIICPKFITLTEFLAEDFKKPRNLLALNNITTPRNVGMIIRSVVAAGTAGILYPKQGVASLGPLVIKASAGTIFRAPIIECHSIIPALSALHSAKFKIVTLEPSASESLFDYRDNGNNVFILGGETLGVDPTITSMADRHLCVQMANKVESLNVSVIAALLAFHLNIKNNQ